ncbi:MAG: uroporphyrinogen-III synthase [Desertimonas sp.]
MSTTAPRPLHGYTVGVTGHRRWEEQAELLARRGAQVLHGPVMETSLLGDVDTTLRATDHVLAAPVDVTILTTGIGVRSWFAAAESVGLDGALRDRLNMSRILARGPKALHAARAVGLEVGWSASSETVEEVLAEVAGSVAGRRVVVQRDGGAPIVAGAISAAGATDVVDVAIYEWHLPIDARPAQRLLDAAAHGDVDALTFTSSYAVGNAFAISDDTAVLVDALNGPVLAAAVGPVTAGALRDHGVHHVVEPNTARLGAMVHVLTRTLAARSRTLTFEGVSCTWQGALLVDAAGNQVDLTTGERRLLRTLADRSPAVVAKEELGEDGVDGHAVESAVARLRAKLGPLGRGIRTVRRRGYACELRARPVVAGLGS